MPAEKDPLWTDISTPIITTNIASDNITTTGATLTTTVKQTESKTNIFIIVGSAIVVFFILILSIYLICRRKKTGQCDLNEEDDTGEQDEGVQLVQIQLSTDK